MIELIGAMVLDSVSVESSSSDSIIFKGPKTPELLLGEQDDVLIPSQQDIEKTYRDGEETWAHFLRKSEALSRGIWPGALLDPYIAITDVPRLPPKLWRGEMLHGQPI